jgi:hypothetical protein
MDDEQWNEFLETRYLDQLRWYEKKSAINKRYYYWSQWAVILFSALTPVLVVGLPRTWNWVSACVSTVVAVGASATKVFKFQENWMVYRATAESLKQEKIFMLAGLDEYATAPNKRSTFVKRVETLLSREATMWHMANRSKDERTLQSFADDVRAAGHGSIRNQVAMNQATDEFSSLKTD